MGKPIIYLDGHGKEHEANVIEANQRHPGYVTLAYFDASGNPVKLFDVPHMEHESRADIQTVKDRFGNDVQQGNPDLPHYDINCWKEYGEDSKPLPADHPAFDHPWKQPEYDQAGNRIPVVRTEYEKDIAEHRARYAPSAEGEPAALEVGSKTYSDGTTVTGVLPLPNLSPAQQDALDGKPSGADLDAVAADQAAKDATTPE
jgi:hypothetical protein